MKVVDINELILHLEGKIDESNIDIIKKEVDNTPPIIIPIFKNGIYIKQKAMQIIRELLQSMEKNKDSDSVPEEDILAVREVYNIIVQAPVEEPEKPEEEKEEPNEETLETSEVQEEEPVNEVEEEPEEEKEEVEE